MTDHTAIVVRVGQQSTWQVWDGNGLVRQTPLELPCVPECAVANDSFAAAICNDRVLAWEWRDGKAVPREFGPFPKSFVPCSLDLIADMLVVGGAGKRTGQSLYRRSLGNSATWQPVPLPDEMLQPGKPIDALVHNDENIFAVDDLVLPRWLLVYPRAGQLADLPTLTHPLPWNGSYEHFHAAAVGSGKLALLSRTSNRGHIAQHVTVLSLDDLEPIAGYGMAVTRQERRSAVEASKHTEWEAPFASGC